MSHIAPAIGAVRALGALATGVALLGCGGAPCDGHPSHHWNGDGAWDFLGAELPVGERGDVCVGSNDKRLSIDHGLPPEALDEVRARWRAWLEEHGWEQEPGAAEAGGLGTWGRGEHTLEIEVSARWETASTRVERLDRPPRLPIPEALLAEGAARVSAITRAVDAWDASDSTLCDQAILKEARGERPPPLALLDRAGLGLMSREEREATGWMSATDRRVESPRSAPDDGSVKAYRAAKDAARRARTLKRSPLVAVLHLETKDVTAPRVLPGADVTSEGRKVTRFSPGVIHGAVLIVDGDGGEVACHLPVSASNTMKFDTVVEDAMGALWADLSVRATRRVEELLESIPATQGFESRRRILGELEKAAGEL